MFSGQNLIKFRISTEKTKKKKKKKFNLRRTRPGGEEKNKKIRKMLEMSWKTPHANMSNFYFFPTSSREIWQNLTNKKKKKKIRKMVEMN